MILLSDEAAPQPGIAPLARIVSHGFVAGPDVSLHAQPAHAIEAALARISRAAGSLAAVEINEAFAAVEINEAFAAVATHSTRLLDVDPEIVNAEIVNAHGGAIALGHPFGASGARIIGHLSRRRVALGPGPLGAAGISGGGGQGSAVVLEAS